MNAHADKSLRVPAKPMFDRLVLVACLVVALASVVFVPFPEGLAAIGVVGMLSAGFILAFRRFTDEKSFITTVFLAGLALRLAFGLFIYVFDLGLFFGGDHVAYDLHGFELANAWNGLIPFSQTFAANIDIRSGSAWGMGYIVGAIYYVLGRNFFAAQSIFGVLGAATAPLAFFLTRRIFGNIKAAKIAAVFIAVYPSFIIWSGQLLKDGFIIFLLALAMCMVMELQHKFSYVAVATLIISMFGILSLRFYIFYMLAISIGASLLVGLSGTKQSLMRNMIVLLLVGLGLVYLGAGRQADAELAAFGNLERVQISREALSKSNSGFETDVDVSTAGGALSAIPIGFVYLMFAPFPWQAANIRQGITIPEVLVWWALMPLLLLGIYYSVRYKLRNTFPVLIFSFLLTVGYCIFQGNVGTAYRQRTQIQLFLFILISAGYVVWQEMRENKKLVRLAAQQRVEAQIRGRMTPHNV